MLSGGSAGGRSGVDQDPSAGEYCAIPRHGLGIILLAGALSALNAAPTSAADRFMVFTTKLSLSPAFAPPSEMLANDVLHWTALQWSGWGQPTATATGEAIFDETGYRAPVTLMLMLDTRRNCAGYRLYTHVSASYPTDPTLQGSGGDTLGGTRPCRIAMLTTEPGLGYTDAVRPRRFVFGDIGFRKFSWKRWGQRSAFGSGRAVAFNTPRAGVPARVKLSNAGPCGDSSGGFAYRRFQYRIKLRGHWKRFPRVDLCR